MLSGWSQGLKKVLVLLSMELQSAESLVMVPMGLQVTDVPAEVSSRVVVQVQSAGSL